MSESVPDALLIGPSGIETRSLLTLLLSFRLLIGPSGIETRGRQARLVLRQHF